MPKTLQVGMVYEVPGNEGVRFEVIRVGAGSATVRQLGRVRREVTDESGEKRTFDVPYKTQQVTKSASGVRVIKL